MLFSTGIGNAGEICIFKKNPKKHNGNCSIVLHVYLTFKQSKQKGRCLSFYYMFLFIIRVSYILHFLNYPIELSELLNYLIYPVITHTVESKIIIFIEDFFSLEKKEASAQRLGQDY